MPNEDVEFESAKSTFPSKEMLKDRLVAVYVNGRKGTEQGENGPYDWYGSTTVVLDDGPDGWQAEVQDKDGDPLENLIPSVQDDGPVVLRNFRWSTGGMTARMSTRKIGGPAMVGRINKRKSAKGAAAWSIAPATQADMDVAAEHAALCKAERLATLTDGEAEPAF
jgi:hypothetical protein